MNMGIFMGMEVAFGLVMEMEMGMGMISREW